MISSVEDPPFITGLTWYAGTLPDHICPSAAKTYLGCSLKFYFERVACIRKKTPSALHLGKAVHAALQAFHLARWRGADDSPETIAAAYGKAFAALAIVAGCVSTDATRHILNGVYFTPEDDHPVMGDSHFRGSALANELPGEMLADRLEVGIALEFALALGQLVAVEVRERELNVVGNIRHQPVV